MGLRERIKSFRLAAIFKRYGASQYIMRLFAAFFIGWFVLFLAGGRDVTSSKIYEFPGFALFLCLTAVLFGVLLFIKNHTAVYGILFGGAGLYALFAAYSGKDWYFSIGLCALICVLVWCFGVKLPKGDMGKISTGISLGMIAAAFCVFVGGVCCLLVRNYMTHCYDFGIFSQMFYYMKETGKCLTTCERDELLNHFAVHFSPIYYVILPFYMLVPHPCTLVVIQTLIVASGVVPLVLLCRHYGFKNITAVFFSTVYLLYPAFMGGCFFYLHENCFLAPLILWYFYLSEKGYSRRTLIVLILILLVKEDAAVYAAVVALYFAMSKKNTRTNLCAFIISVAYFITVTKIMGVYGQGIMTDSRYGEYIYDGGGLITVIKSVLQNPAFTVMQIFKEEKLLFIIQTTLPLCFLPFAVKNPAKLVLFIPYILVNLMPNWEYQYNIGYQYVFGSGTLLIFLAVSNYAEMGTNRRKMLLSALLCSAVLFSGGYFREKASTYTEYTEQADWREKLDRAVSLIPKGRSVAASSLLVTMLSDRDEVYMLEYTKQETDIIVIDLRFSDTAKYLTQYNNDSFRPIVYIDGTVAVYERVK